MSNSYNYLPIPPRAWSRVQNPCTYIIPDNSYNSIYIPLTNQTTSLAQALFEDKIQYKGNILQYKGNSSRLTKKQKYSKISNRLWTNRTTVHATQTQTYSNPNTTGFARINSVNIPFPNQIVGSPNNISGPYQYGIPNPNNCNTTSIEDGGSLLCGSYANPCTGEITQNVYEQQCFPTYCSDVPGQIMDLCWNPKMQTYFPKNRSTMSNSGNKFPQGYKGFVSAVTPVAPVLTLVSYIDFNVTLSWTSNNNTCIPVSYLLYQQGIQLPIQTIPFGINTVTLTDINNCESTSYYLVSASTGNNIVSEPSNIVTVYNSFLFTPILSGSYSTINIGEVSLFWNANCGAASWNIYQNDVLVANVPNSSTNMYTFYNLPLNSSYDYYIVAVNNNEQISNIVNIVLPPLYSTNSNNFTPFTYANPGYTGVVFYGSSTLLTNTITFNYIINNINVLAVGGGGGGGQAFNPNTQAGGGGGGGGISLATFTSSIATYSIQVGNNGNGTGTSPGNTPGGTTSISLSTTYIASATGGQSATSTSTSYVGGGGGYGTFGSSLYNGGGGGYGQYQAGITLPPYIYTGGANSGLINITIPTTNSTTGIILNLSGGGGGAVGNVNTLFPSGGTPGPEPGGYGGTAGAGNGGITGGNSTSGSGVTAISSFSNNGGFGGGGGGTAGFGNPTLNSGNGATGVLILWWETN